MSKPGNAIGVSVLNAPVAADAVLANGVVTITGLPPINWRDIVGYQETVSEVGQVQDDDINFTTMVGVNAPVVGQAYKVVLRPNLIKVGVAEIPVGQTEVYIAVATTVGVADLSVLFETAIAANTQSKFTAADLAGVLTITQNDFSIDGFSIPEIPGGASFAVGANAFAKPAGTQALVQEDVHSSVVVDAVNFKRYEIEIDNRKAFDSSGDVTAQKVLAIVYADDLDAGFGVWDAAINTIMNGTGTAAEYIAHI